jgi:hypothetical protein
VDLPQAGAVLRVRDKRQKHFDADRDGYLGRYEFQLLKTHLHFGYPLARKIAEKAYDFNQTLMLEPSEVALLAKEKGSLQYRERVQAFRRKLREKDKTSGRQPATDNVTKPGNRPLF